MQMSNGYNFTKNFKSEHCPQKKKLEAAMYAAPELLTSSAHDEGAAVRGQPMLRTVAAFCLKANLRA
jgi:hypothetical protein